MVGADGGCRGCGRSGGCGGFGEAAGAEDAGAKPRSRSRRCRTRRAVSVGDEAEEPKPQEPKADAARVWRGGKRWWQGLFGVFAANVGHLRVDRDSAAEPTWVRALL